jgi:hypothetical protein
MMTKMTYGREVLLSRDEIFAVDFLLSHVRTQGNPGQNARMFFMQTFFTPDRTIEHHIDQVTQKFAIMRESFKDQTILQGMLEQPSKKKPVKPLAKSSTPTFKKKKKATNGRRTKKKTTHKYAKKKTTKKKKRRSR